MTEQQFGDHRNKAGGGQSTAGVAETGESISPADRSQSTTAAAGAAGSAPKPGGQAVVGTFTLRDLVALGAVLVMFIGSLLPIFRAGYVVNLWNGASLFFVGIGIVLPLIVAGLFLARRLASGSTFRVGSLSVDQFGSVVASFAAAYFFLSLVSNFGLGFLIALIGSLGLLAATVAAPWLPFFAADFTGRPESAAHRVARDAVLPVRKPAAAPKPAVRQAAGPGTAGSAPVPTTGSAASGAASGQRSVSQQPGVTGSTGRGNSGVSSAASQPTGPQAATGNNPASEAARPAAGTAGTAHSGSGPARAAASSSDPVAAAPELSQFLGGAAAGGGVAAAAQSLPAERQASAGNRAASPAQQESAGSEGNSSAAGARSANEPKAAGRAQGTGTDALAPAAEPVDESLSGVPPTTVNPTVQARRETIGATVDPATRSEAGDSHDQQNNGHDQESGADSAHTSAYDAFWFAVDRPRPVVDEKTGGFLYNVEPGNWILALHDRGQDFLVQNTDGRVGVLRDLRNIERAPEGE